MTRNTSGYDKADKINPYSKCPLACDATSARVVTSKEDTLGSAFHFLAKELLDMGE